MTATYDGTEPMHGRSVASKIAEVTAIFWVLKVFATTLGETAGDFLSQTLNLGYVAGLGITGAILAALLGLQIRSRAYHPALFWAAITGTTMAGTEVSDLMDRTLGLGYALGSALLLAGLLVSLLVWYRREGNLSVTGLSQPGVEVMFWVAVLFSNSLGTAYGDFLVDNLALGYGMAAVVCTAVIVGVLILHYTQRVNDIALFWIAFIFTRPFGATFGDLLTKPIAKGGLNLGTLNASVVCFAAMALLVFAQTRRLRH